MQVTETALFSFQAVLPLQSRQEEEEEGGKKDILRFLFFSSLQFHVQTKDIAFVNHFTVPKSLMLTV